METRGDVVQEGRMEVQGSSIRIKIWNAKWISGSLNFIY